MKITSLSIKNFGIINDETFNFEDGIFVFSGDNGEGKSTVLKAISLLLFNRVPGKMSDYIQWGKSEASLACVFSHNSIFYETTLKIGSNGTERFLKNLSTKEEITSTSAVNEKINEILDVKRAIASTTSFEHEIDLITTSPSERREYLKKVYDLSFKTEQERIVNDIEKTKTNSSEISSEISTLSSLEFELQSLDRPPFPKSRYEEKKDYIIDLEKRIKNTESDFSKEKNKLDEIKSKKNKKSLKEDEKSKLQQEIESTHSKILSQETKIENLNNFSSRDIDEKYSRKQEEIQEKIDSLKDNIEISKNALEIRIPRDLEILAYNSDAHNSLKEEVYSEKINILNLKKKFQDLSDGVCPVCGTKFDSEDLSYFKGEIEDLEEHFERKLEQLSEMDSKKKKFEEILELKRNYTSEMKSDVSSLQSLTENLKELKISKEEEIENRKREQESLLSSAKEVLQLYIANNEDKEKLIKGLEDDISKLELEISEDRLIRNNIELLEEEISKLTKDLNTNREDIKSYEQVLLLNEEKKKMNESIELKKKQVEERILDLQKSLEENQKNLSSYLLALKILTKDFPSFVISRLIENLQSYTNEFLQQVYPKYTLSFEESKSTLSVLYNGVDVKLASGFEKQVFSFAYKYALGKIQNYNILFLDEVDSAASEENSKLFYDTLAKMIDFFSQIFIITHKQDTKELLSTDHSATVYNIQGGKVEKL